MFHNIINNFAGGRNSDTSPDKIPTNQYLEAQDVEIVGDGEFFSLRNIKGTTSLQSVGQEILRVFANKYLIGGKQVECLTVFSSSDTTFKIQCYDVENDTLYDLYSEAANYTGRTIDAVNGPENGVDVLYFTDGVSELRQLRCEIPSPYSANFLTAYDLSLLRKGANGSITLTSVSSGGTLLSGTYQFAYRMADPTNKRFTKWSSITNPIHVYSAENSKSVVTSGIGQLTNRKITLEIEPSKEETDNFDHLQLAVIENIGPTPATTASLLDIIDIPSTSVSYDYKSNAQLGTIPLADLTIDLAQIETVKTLNIKDNRLFGGNVKYTQLEFDNGDPETGGEVITAASSGVDTFSDDEYASKNKGYWRGEVYRFGIVYYDKDGNRSPVKVLDLSSVADNTITGSLTDLKFPDRTNPDYTLFNSSGQIQSLGLRLTNLINHPSWARRLEIVRVDRKGRYKNILFQTPIIPMVRVYGTGALQRYPTQMSYDSTANTKDFDNATPMTSGYTLVPKNLFWPDNRYIMRIGGSSGSGINKRFVGEAELRRVFSGGDYTYSMIFPTPSLYDPSNPFSFSGAEKLDFVDYALMRLTADDNKISKSVAVVNGDDLNTSISGTFYALSDNQYYYNNGHGKAALSSSFLNKPIVDSESFDNSGQPTTVSGTSVMDFDSLQTGGVGLGFKPTAQKSAVIRLSGIIVSDATEGSRTFSAATWNGTSNGGAITSAKATLTFESNTAITNTYVTDYANFSNGDFASVIAITNVKLGLGDDRYGDTTDLHEFVSTGCTYTFSDTEVATLEAGGSVTVNQLDVWGGDCFVGPHVFKVADSAYSVVNQPKNNGSSQALTTLLSKWNNMVYRDFDTDTMLCLPVAVEGAAQYVQVVLESDYNGEVREPDILTGSSASVPVMTAEAESARTPLTYKYNINLSQGNTQKIFVPKPEHSFEQDEFGSRVIYSDLKIYNSDQAGFDIFRVGNIYDIDEKFRPITKLAVAGNQLYAIHDNGVVYLPTGEQMIEQTDTNTLAVRSGEVIGKHLIVDSERGSQHLQSVVETGGIIYLADNRNKCVYGLGGQQLQSIIKDNETIFRSMFATKLEDLVGVYDPIRGEYWISDGGSNCHVYNERLGAWVSNHTMPDLKASGFANRTLLLALDDEIHSAYTGDPVAGTVQMCVNPNPGNAKTFDNQKVDASKRLSGANFVVIGESSNQTSSASLNINPREGNYRFPVLVDENNKRLRGMYCLVTYTWGAEQSSLRSVTTIYRISSRGR